MKKRLVFAIIGICLCLGLSAQAKKTVWIVSEGETEWDNKRYEATLAKFKSFADKASIEVIGKKVLSKEAEMKALFDDARLKRPDAIIWGPQAVGIGIVKNLEKNYPVKIFASGIPAGDYGPFVTGIITPPTDIQAKAYAFFKSLVPLNGKKAVFLTVDGFFKEAEIAEALRKNDIPLKEYITVRYQEDWKVAVEKYNKDDEVGWILCGVWPAESKSGKADQLAIARWDIQNRKKPTVTFWEAAVQMGILAGLGADLSDVGIQTADMCASWLGGKPFESIGFANPRKLNIYLNTKRAKDLGVTIPYSILGSAYRLYTDYEGTFVQQ